MRRAGKSLQEVRAAIDAEYRGRTPTPTLYPPK